MRVFISSIVSIREYISASCADLVPASRPFNLGKCAALAAKVLYSRGLAFPKIMRVIIRSRSYIPESSAAISPESIGSLRSVSTAQRRLSIFTGSRSGLSIYDRKSLFPIAVLVLSSTQRSVPRFSRPRIVSVSSKFRLAERSSFINAPSE